MRFRYYWLLSVFWFVAFLPSIGMSAVTTQYTFENDLLDSALSGVSADHLTAIPATGPLATTYDTGIVGQAVRISLDAGNATVLQAADSNDLDLTASWTLEAFVKPDLANTAEWDRFATKWFDGSNQWHWAFRNQAPTTNGQDLFMNGAQTINSSVTVEVPLDEWTHVAWTGDSGDPASGIKLWQNGAVVGSAAYQAVSAGTDAFRLGNFMADQAALQFSGLVDEFMIHDVAQGAAYMEARADLIPDTSPPPVEPPPTTGLVSYWTFDETIGDVANGFAQNVGVTQDDLTPRGGAVNYETGQIGDALRIGVDALDLTDLRAAVSPDVNLPATYTIEAWVKPSELTDAWQRLVLNWGADTSYHFAIRNNSGFANGVSLFHEQADGVQPNANGGTVVVDQWQHIAGVADGSNLIVYLDGEVVASVPYDGTIHTATSEGLGIADSDTALSGLKFNGLLDDLAIWSVPLNPDQIRFQYQQGLLGNGATVPEPTSMGWLFFVGILVMRTRRRTGRV